MIKKIVKCASCKKSIGEIDYDAEVTYPQCSNCADPKPYDYANGYNTKTRHNTPNISMISQVK